MLSPLIAVLLFTAAARAEGNSTTNLFIYVPNKPAAIISGIIYILVSLLLLARIWKFRHWWGLCLPIGAFAIGTGFIIRFVMSRSTTTSLGLYIIEDVLIVCSPAAFLAFNYIVYGRLFLNSIEAKHSLIRPQITSKVFVFSDVATFFIQASGGGLETMKSTTKLGEDIFLVGLVAQAASYVVFMGLLFHAHRGARKDRAITGQESWWRVIWLLYFSSFFILIRSAYRVISGAQGRLGYLSVHEAFFYVFDTIPLLLAIGVYIPFWPGLYAELSTKLDAYGMATYISA